MELFGRVDEVVASLNIRRSKNAAEIPRNALHVCPTNRRPFKAAGFFAGRVEDGTVVGHPEMHKPRSLPALPIFRCCNLPKWPTGRTSGPAGFGHIPVPGWVQRKPAFGFGARKKEKRVHWSARVEGLSLVYLANVWREEGEELLFFSPPDVAVVVELQSARWPQ